jgi:arginase
VAVKIVRQPNKIALLGAPTSAAAMSEGHEGAPAALRAAGIVERLREAGYEVTDLGDDPVQLYQPDEESPRARNLPRVIASLEALKPRVEQATKSGALPLILAGDCSIALATIAGLRRYYRNVSMIYFDRDADVHTPATTTSGCLDGMVVSHLTGRGAAEMVRFWGEPPLIREPDMELFGTDRFDPAEEDLLRTSPLRHHFAAEIHRIGAAAAAEAALVRLRGDNHQFVLHFDVDVIPDFQATNYPGSGGLNFEEVSEALSIFAKQKQMAAIDVTAYNPKKDPDGSGAKRVIDLIVDVLKTRLEVLKAAAENVPPEPVAVKKEKASPSDSEIVAKVDPEVTPIAEVPEIVVPPVAPGEAWSADSLDDTEDAPSPGTSEETDEFNS